jgi:hypothetical protein
MKACGKIVNLQPVKLCCYATNIKFLNGHTYTICKHPERPKGCTVSRLNCSDFRSVEEK